MKVGKHKYWKKESRYYVLYKGRKYIRNECVMNEGFHIIRWDYEIPDESKRKDGPLHYYSSDSGWKSNDRGIISKKQAPPEVEFEFNKLGINDLK